LKSLKKARPIILTAALICLFSLIAYAAANFVYHEQSSNYVASPDCDAPGGTDTTKGKYVENTFRNPGTFPGSGIPIQLLTSEIYTLRFKVEFQFFTNRVSVFYTTDGTNPTTATSVTGGVTDVNATGTTQEVVASYAATFRDANSSCQVVDIATASIPAQTVGTNVKYVIAAWHTGGGNVIFANSGDCCSGCTSHTCATVFSYVIVPPPSNFDGDKRSDVSVWQDDTTHNWVVRKSTGGTEIHTDWGSSALGDRIAPGDYDRDGKMDYAIYRPSEGNWYVVKSSDGAVLVKNWGGVGGDIPVPGDYDGDGDTDFGIYRPAEGNWYVLNNGTNAVFVRQWGASTDRVIQADYDADGKTDLAVFRPSEGNWYIINSATNTVTVRQWGVSTDQVVLGDYNGDGRADFAVWRPSEGNWYILTNGISSTVTVKSWGASTDTPVPADYDGDGRTDIAVWRGGEGNWYILQSATNTAILENLGGSTDTPVPSAYVR
jgi:hypothetical protein